MKQSLLSPMLTLFLRSVRDEDWPDIMALLRLVLARYEEAGPAGVRGLLEQAKNGPPAHYQK